MPEVVSKKIILEADLDVLKVMAEMTGMISAVKDGMSEADKEGYNRIKTQFDSLSAYEKLAVRKTITETLDLRKKEIQEVERWMNERYNKERQQAKELGEEQLRRIEDRHRKEMEAIEEQKRSLQEVSGERGPSAGGFEKASEGIEQLTGKLGQLMATVGKIVALIGVGETLLKAAGGIEAPTILGYTASYPREVVRQTREDIALFLPMITSMFAAGDFTKMMAGTVITDDIKGVMNQLMSQYSIFRAFGVSPQEYTRSLDILGRVGLTERGQLPSSVSDAMLVGMSRGMTMEQTSSMFADLSYKFRVPTDELARTFMAVSEPIKDSTGKIVLAGEEAAKQTMELAKGFRILGYGLGDSRNMVAKFSEEIREGKISVGELNNMIKSVTEREPGTFVFAAQQLMGLAERAVPPEMMGVRSILKRFGERTGYSATELAGLGRWIDAAREDKGQREALEKYLRDMGITEGGAVESLMRGYSGMLATAVRGITPGGLGAAGRRLLEPMAGEAITGYRAPTAAMEQRYLQALYGGDLEWGRGVPRAEDAQVMRARQSMARLRNELFITDNQAVVDFMMYTDRRKAALKRMESLIGPTPSEGAGIPGMYPGAYRESWVTPTQIWGTPYDPTYAGRVKTIEGVLEQARLSATQPGGHLYMGLSTLDAFADVINVIVGPRPTVKNLPGKTRYGMEKPRAIGASVSAVNE